MVLGPDFRKLIKEAGWNQKRLSSELGYSEGWLSNIINGKRDMLLSDFRAIVHATGIAPHKLLGIELPNNRTDWQKMATEIDKVLPPEARDLLLKMWRGKRDEG